MSNWSWFFGWNLVPLGWVAFVILLVIAQPVLLRYRAWNAKRRFIRSEGAKLDNPEHADARFRLASIYAENRQWRKASRYARDAIESARRNPLYEGQVPYHFLRLLGDALYHARRYREAADAYEKSLRSPSQLGYAESRLGLGKTLYRLGRPEKALEQYRVCREDQLSNLEVHFRIAQASWKLGRTEEARAARSELRRVAETLPSFARKRWRSWRLANVLFPVAKWVA